jgi:tRNA pseudouridine55 synthase
LVHGFLQGFLNLHKPLGITSHDCVGQVRRILKTKRVGHGGTLDPQADGVLPIAVGKATRLLQFLPSDKAYQGTVKFGLVTNTDDLAGEVIARTDASHLTLEEIEKFLPDFLGKIKQIPPRFSAIHVGGKRLYDLARQGETVEIPERSVEIFALRVMAWRPGDLPELDLDIACGAGTYIRAIARDLGEKLGTGGTLAKLTRSKSAGFDLANSITLEELADQLQAGNFPIISPTIALSHLPMIALTEEQAKKWCQGQRSQGENINQQLEKFGDLTDQIHWRIYDPTEQFLGIGELLVERETDHPENQSCIIPKVVFI